MNEMDLAAVVKLVEQARESSVQGQQIANALNQATATLADIHEQLAERADPNEDAKSRAEIAATNALREALLSLPDQMRQALAAALTNTKPQIVPAPAPAPTWSKLNVQVNADRMGRMESFTIEKVA